MKVGKYKIPFAHDDDGRVSLLEYTTSDEGDTAPRPGIYNAQEWRTNEPFDATVRLVALWRVRSAARIGVVNTENQERYSLGLAAFYDAVEAFGCEQGEITGTWVFRKQGSNYGLYPYAEDE